MNYLPKLSLVAFFLASSLYAQDTLVKSSSIPLDEVVLSASNWAQNQLKVPQKVAVISKKSILLE